MKTIITSLVCFLLIIVVMNTQAQTIKGEEITYTAAEGTALKGYVAYDAARQGKLPVVVVIHEWWGSNQYVRKRADMLAALGYFAFAVDMYGEGKQGNNPQEAGALAGPFYSNPTLVQTRIEAALLKIKEYTRADAGNMACIGYCFGGSMSLYAAKLGMPFKAVVSFHGGLAGVPAEAGKTTAKILVCHGGADKFISDEEIKTFRQNLDSVKVDYSFISYPGAVHAFSNPQATEMGKKFGIPIEYNEDADKKSWADMTAFFNKIFIQH
jgi:dienelactone hydrolase